MGVFCCGFNFTSIASPGDTCNTERGRTALPVTGSSLGVWKFSGLSEFFTGLMAGLRLYSYWEKGGEALGLACPSTNKLEVHKHSKKFPESHIAQLNGPGAFTCANFM